HTRWPRDWSSDVCSSDLAGMWQFVRRPWELVSGGAGSGVYRSKDGGLTWERLTPGLPSGVTGNTAVAVGPTNPSHVYALIETNEIGRASCRERVEMSGVA